MTKLNKELARIVHLPDVKERFAAQCVDPVGSTGEEFTAFTKEEIEKWAKVVKASGARVE